MSDTDPTLSHAHDTLNTLLNHMGFEVHVSANWVEPSAADEPRTLLLLVEGDDLNTLIGPKGNTLAALQYLTRLMTGKQVQMGVKLLVDVQGFRQRHEEQLQRMAQRVAEQVTQRGRSIALEPMNSDERRLIHIALRDHPTVYTESAGEGDHRKVVIYPKKI